MKKTISSLLIAMLATTVNAGTIVSGGSVISSTMGEYPGPYVYNQMLNQSGLSSNYVSGVTDFATFTGSGVSHNGGDSNSWLSSPGVYSGFVTFDLGSIFNIQRFVMWNGTSGIDASPNGFSLETSMFSDFSVSSLVGNFIGHQSNYDATVYDLTDSTARYVRLTIDGNFGNSCCTGIGDLAFDVNDVPEPGNLALLGIGFAGLAYSRRKKPV